MNKKTNTKNIALVAGAVLGSAMASFSVYADGKEIYNKDGITVTMEEDNGKIKMVLENKTDKDLKDVVLKNDDIEGLTLDKKEIPVGDVKKGEKKDISFSYELKKAAVSVLEEKVTSDKKSNSSQRSSEKEQKAEGTKGSEKVDKKANGQEKKTQTGDISEGKGSLIKIAVPITLCGVAGILAIYAVKRKKNSKASALAILLSAGVIGASMFAISTSADGLKINKETGREMYRFPVSGTTTIDGETYDYAGNFEYELDHLENTTWEQVLFPNITIKTDEDLAVGKFVMEEKGQVGKISYTGTLVNGRSTTDEKEVSREEAKDYVVRIGTKPVVTKESAPHKTVYQADNTKNYGETETVTSGEDGEKETTKKLKKDYIELLKNAVRSETLDEDFIEKNLTETVTKETKAVKDTVIAVGTKETEEVPVKHDTKVTEDESKWESYHNVDVPGKDGKDIVTFEYKIVDPATGEVSGKEEVSRETVEKPVTEEITNGTKTHEWKSVHLENNPIPHQTEFVPAVSALSEIDTQEKYTQKKNDYDKRVKENGNSNILQQGEDGVEEVTQEVAVREDGTPHPDFEPRNVQKTEKKAPVTEKLFVWNAKTEQEEIPFATRYTKDETKAYGEKTDVTPGENGTKISGVLLDNEGKNKVESAVIGTVPAKDAVVSVGTLQTEEVPVEFQKKTQNDDTKWDNYRNVEVEGKNGTDKIFYTSDVDEKTGELSGKVELRRETVEKPTDEVTVIGTKQPEFVEHSEVKTLPKPETVLNDLFTKEEVEKEEDYNTLREKKDTFLQKYGARIVDRTQEIYRMQDGHEGKETTTTRIAVDPATKLPIPDYPKGEPVVTVEEGASDVNVHVNLKEIDHRDSEEKWTYVADDSLQLGEKEEDFTHPALPWQEYLVELTDGSQFWKRDLQSGGQDGIMRVGNVEIKDVVTKGEIVEIPDYSTFVGEDIDGQNAENGLEKQITTYQVNPENGTLSNPTTQTTVVKQAKDGSRFVGVLQPVGESLGSEVTHKMLYYVNQYRVEHGKNELVFDEVDAEEAMKTAHALVAYAVQFHKFEHLARPFNANITMFHIAGLSADEIAKQAVQGWIESPSHAENMLRNGTKLAVGAWKTYMENYGADYGFFNMDVME